MTDDSTRSLVSRTIAGTEVLVSTESNEIFLDIPETGQEYIRVVEGELVREGDVRSRDERELESQTLQVWEVDNITTETVLGTGVDTGDSKEWDRDILEQKLVNGTLSTDLTGFERADVSQSGASENGTGASNITVTVYGNSGQKFQQTFNEVDGNGETSHQLQLFRSDPKADEFDEDLHTKFIRTVEVALRNEGFSV